ncbi:PLP-dependent aminotransferase family protein [Actinacidiphila sp. ITFR-21]|uniref:MocR-like pyridoxine biosynthesis transcription factor PdxR n=1 Tax=Actinacidiphila sp. ITFR-21 TaxID=3075199 RepID=UPI00288C26FC|nr:PLP-dependent aminotransferase family protein [Streptomyces sp. ITFR-21]WNI18886.1 PLP-dependent aminotransferase family protein [Streptomyces sp. ITFR-21]
MTGTASGLDLWLELPARGSRARAVEEALRTAIREGRLPAGTRLPPTRSLAAELGLSRGTVNQAYAQLAGEGWLTTAPGRAGTRVAEQPRPEAAAPAPAAVVRPEPRHDLAPGRPDVASFPRAEWLRATRQALRDAPAEAFGYGDPRGRPELRTALAGYLGRARGVRVDPAHIVVCSGYTQALGLLTAVLADLGAGCVGMEDPALGDHVAVARRRLTVVDVPVDGEGMRVSALARSAADAVACTPAHQFPVGVSLSPARRAALLSWARERDGWIVEDDYDGEFRYDRRPVGALQAHNPARVVYVGTTSKSLGPGVRIGWIACPPRLLEPLVEAKSLADRVTSPLDQLALAGLIASGGYDRHLRTMRQRYRRRRDELTAATAVRLPGARVTGIAAGLHAILELPPGTPPEEEVMAALTAASVRVHPLSAYRRAQVPAAAPRLVVGYATPAAHAYSSALDALFTVLGEPAAARGRSGGGPATGGSAAPVPRTRRAPADAVRPAAARSVAARVEP